MGILSAGIEVCATMPGCREPFEGKRSWPLSEQVVEGTAHVWLLLAIRK